MCGELNEAQTEKSRRFWSDVHIAHLESLFPAAGLPLHCRPMSDTLVINEIYLSIQGESTFAGLPCVFVRLTACNLRCSYCDTAYAFTEGKKMSLGEVLSEVRRLATPFPERAFQAAAPSSVTNALRAGCPRSVCRS